MSSNVRNFPDLKFELTGKIIGAAIEVHKHLGPGLLESVYEACLFQEIKQLGLHVEKQKILPVTYKDLVIEQGFRLDLFVENKIIIELKAVEEFLPIHRAQVISYMRLSQSPLGLLINFNKKVLKDGIQRFALTEFEGI